MSFVVIYENLSDTTDLTLSSLVKIINVTIVAKCSSHDSILWL
jgi:hypothetical protein